MKRFSEQFKKQADRVGLRAAERRELKDRLVSYMEYHPLPKTTAQINAERYISSDSFTLVRINTPALRGIIGAFAVLLLVVVPIVAERSVPGDVLYAVKVNFNEEIRSGLSVSPYAKVEWETQRLERRIAEARLLASEGRLTDEVEAEVAEAVKAHSDAAQEGIAILRETDSDEAAIAGIAFESALTVQSEVLEGALKKEVASLGTASSTPGRSIAGLATVVEAARKSASESQGSTLPSYEKLSARIEFETTRTYELFESVKTVALESEVNDIERRLADIERKIMAAAEVQDVFIADGASTTSATSSPVSPAVPMLRAVLTDLQKLISFMTDIDVRENVTIEELVPVVLTEEERLAALDVAKTTITAQLETVKVQFDLAVESDATEKIAFGINEVEDHLAKMVIAREEADLDAAEDHSAQAQALLSDLQALLGQPKVEEALDSTATSVATTTPEVTVPSEASSTASSTGTTTDTVEEEPAA